MEADLAAAMTEMETVATEGGEAAGAGAAEGFGGYFKKMIIGLGLEQVGTVLSGGIESAVSAVAQSGDTIAKLTAQIEQQRAEIQVHEAALQKATGTIAASSAAHQKAAADIDAEKAKLTELTQQLAPLTQAQQGMSGTITGVESAILGWIGAHKQLETSLQTFMTTLGPMLTYIGMALIAITLLQVALSVLSAPLLILIGVGITIALLTATWAAFHTQITSFFNDLNANTGIIDLFKQSWQTISQNFTQNLLPALQQLWTALQPLEPYLQALAIVVGAALLGAIVLLTDALTIAVTLFTDLLTVATKVATFFTNVLVGALNLVKEAIQDIVTLVSKVGSVGGAIGGAISGALGKIPAFATGGIVNGPTLALVGEAGPEAIIPLSAFAGGASLGGSGIGGGGGMVINITGNNISSQLDIRNMAQQVGAEIVRVLRLNQKLSI
jgi:hypothetical protein